MDSGFSQMGIWVACGCPLFKENCFYFSQVALLIAHLNRPCSTFWTPIPKFLTKSVCGRCFIELRVLFLEVSQSRGLTNSLVSPTKENTQCHKLLNQWLLQSSSSPWIICTMGSISFHFPQSIVDGSSPKRIACCFQNSIVLYIVEAYGPVIIPTII